ncbi:MAG: hypothetical protein U0P30_00820 [Vicinamibacterales bacterium]
MGDDHHGAPPLGGQRAQQVHHELPARRVERGGGLVGEDDRRIAGQSPRDRDTLLLTAGEVGGQAVRLVGEAHGAQRVEGRRTGGAAAHALELQRDAHVLRRRQRGEQVEALEHEPEVPQPHRR